KKGVPADEDQMIRYVLRPSYAQVETLRAALDSIRSPAGNVQAAGNILIITDYSSQIRDMMSLAKTIDVQGANDGVWTIPVKNALAKDLATTLNNALQGRNQQGGAQGRPGAPGQPPAPAPQPGGGGELGASLEGTVRVVNDDPTNSLIVTSTGRDYLAIKNVI